MSEQNNEISLAGLEYQLGSLVEIPIPRDTFPYPT